MARQASLTPVSGGKDRWHDGHRAWARLVAWVQRAAPGRSQTDDGDDALEALADVGFLRHLLDQAELRAVQAARRRGRSWAEIATKLGVTRQSAWERWRELDETSTAETPTTESPTAETPTAEPGESPPPLPHGPATTQVAQWALERRRRASVIVPNVIGMTWDDARRLLHERHLVGILPDPDGPPLAAVGWPDGVVTDQSPESGAKVPVGSAVRLWIERGGGSGVREPRRPKPAPKSGREMRPLEPEPTDEAVG